VSRQANFHAAQDHAPSLLHFLSWAYGRPSRVFLRGVPDNSAPVLSTSDVKQGDTLGPPTFALTLQGPLQRTATAHSATQIVAYYHDINVVGPAAAAAPTFEAVAMEEQTAGLTPVSSNSATYSLEKGVTAAAAAELSVLHARKGLVVATPSSHHPSSSRPTRSQHSWVEPHRHPLTA
jgi:hypothetical protein